MDNNEIFNKALHNFMNDFASGDAIRHLADRGYTVPQIVQMLDYPTPKNKVAEIVWQHYIDIAKICLDEPVTAEYIDKVTYEKHVSNYGRMSMKKVVTRVPAPKKEYVICDYGKRLYQDRDRFLKDISILTEEDRGYILNLPWPLKSVYHELDERMVRICRGLCEER